MKPDPRFLTLEEQREMTRQLAWEYVRDLRDELKEVKARLKALEEAAKNGNRRIE